ncbi:hypothetical protein [Hymenobacter sp. BRD67]|nr:hypothetical protein [Hymenobacter sp. BRD67]
MSFCKLPALLATALLLATVTVGTARAQGTVGDFTVQKNGGAVPR